MPAPCPPPRHRGDRRLRRTRPHQTRGAELPSCEIAARYPEARSGLLPMLHLVQSEEGRVTPEGIEACAEMLGISAGRGQRRRDLLHDVQAQARRRLPRRRLHQHAVRGHGRRPDLRAAQGAPRRRQRRDHRRRHDHPRARRVQRGLRLRPGDDGQLGVHGQPDARLGRPGRRRPARRQGRPLHPRSAAVHLARGRAGARRLPRRPRRRGPVRRSRLAGGPGIARERGWTAPAATPAVAPPTSPLRPRRVPTAATRPTARTPRARSSAPTPTSSTRTTPREPRRRSGPTR